LHKLLKEAKLSQVDLSNLTGMSESLISQYVNGRRMSLNNAKTIADALKCPIDDLYIWEVVTEGNE
jgi:transcriptional regulator with XRE-family HTH domain